MKTKLLALLILAAAFSVSAQLIPYPKSVAADGIDIVTLRSNADGNMSFTRVPAARLADNGVAVCYPDGTYKINGQVYQPKGSKTCGIQEAVNALPVGGVGTPGGGTIVLAPGIFKTANTIYMPSYQSNSYSLKFIGAGIASSGILMTNLIPHEVMRIDPAANGNTNQINFYMAHLFMSSVTNATTNLLALNGAFDSGGNFHGCIGGGRITDCLFGWWNGMTNHYGNVQPDGWDANLGELDLVGISLVNNYGGDFSVDHNTFQFCLACILDNDNTSFTCNQIIGCGRWVLHTSWPSSSPLYLGFTVNLISTTSTPNNIHQQDIGQNHFVGVHTCGYLITQSKANTVLNGDYFEASGAYQIAVKDKTVTALNMRWDSALQVWDITNAVDWSKPFQSDTGLVTTVSWENLADANFKFKTNAAPTSVTIGSTAPDRWIKQTNANDGAVMFIPTWLNH